MGKTDEENTTKRRRLGRGTGILILISVVALAACIVFYVKYRDSQDTVEARQKRIVAQVGRAVELPQSTPAVVTVADKSKLANKELAARVENQDMLLVYGADKRIIIYRPTTQKVVDMLRISTAVEQQPAAASAPTSTAPASTSQNPKN